MNRNLLIGIIGGALVGAATSYLLSADNRSNLVSDIKNLGEKATDLVGWGDEDENNNDNGNIAVTRGNYKGKSSTIKRG